MVKKKESCSMFEEMLLWTSYRYCIGRHTYVTSMAYDMAQHYYNKLSDERKEFSAIDIRREIYDHLRWMHFNYTYNRWNDDNFFPLEKLFEILNKENINTIDEFLKCQSISYSEYEGGHYEINRCENPQIKNYFSSMDLDDLIPWMTLAACFDIKHHKIITLTDDTEVEAFQTYTRKTIPCEDKPGYCSLSEFGWEPIWVSVDDFVKGLKYRYIPEENVKSVKEKSSN